MMRQIKNKRQDNKEDQKQIKVTWPDESISIQYNLKKEQFPITKNIQESKQCETTGINQRLMSTDEFVQNLNKKVVVSKVKLQKFFKQTIKFQQSKLFKQTLKCQQSKVQQNFQNKIEQKSNLQISNCTQKDESQQLHIFQNNAKIINDEFQNLSKQQLKNILKIKDQQISNLKQKVQKLNQQILSLNKTQNKSTQYQISNQYSLGFQINHFNLEKSHKNKNKDLKIDTDKINSQFESKQPKTNSNSISISIQNLIQNSQSPINPQLNQNDPVFKIPCLSPTMLQMKCIQKIENQRRRKLRQLKKDPTATSIISNQLLNLAAGVSSPLNQQMLNNAQNPLKNRFIRKPMTPILTSMSSSYKASKDINQKQDYQIQSEASPSFLTQMNEEKKQPQKLNLPYFMSLKKKNNQSQKQ